MPKPGADKVITQKHRRAYSQPGGPSPVNPVKYSGADETYLMFDDDTNPITGGRDPIRVHSTRRIGGYEKVGETVSPPDNPSGSVTFMHEHGGIPWLEFDTGCYHNFYEVVGTCKNPSDFINGWNDYVKIRSYGQRSESTDAGNASFEDDEQSTTQADFTYAAIYKIAALNFGAVAAAEVEREVVDVVYGGGVECGNCGTADDGTKRIYALTKSSGAGSPGTPAEIQYSIDGGLTWNQGNVTGLGGTTDLTALDIVGNYLVAVDTAGNGYWFAELNTITGAPGSWTNVTSGFVASKQPTDIYVKSASEVYFSGNGGYIYRSTDIPSGVTAINAGSATTSNLQRIHGQDDTIVATGDSGAIVKSLNNGATFTTTTLSPTSATIRAILVLDEYRFWIGTSGGKTYYTINGGETWVEVTLPGGTLAVIDDIVAATDEVIHISARTATPTARLITTWCGGARWTSSASATQRIQAFPTAMRFNRIAVPRDVPHAIAANHIVVGGLSGGGTDGALYLGAANRV